MWSKEKKKHKKKHGTNETLKLVEFCWILTHLNGSPFIVRFMNQLYTRIKIYIFRSKFKPKIFRFLRFMLNSFCCHIRNFFYGNQKLDILSTLLPVSSFYLLYSLVTGLQYLVCFRLSISITAVTVCNYFAHTWYQLTSTPAPEFVSSFSNFIWANGFWLFLLFYLILFCLVDISLFFSLSPHQSASLWSAVVGVSTNLWQSMIS